MHGWRWDDRRGPSPYLNIHIERLIAMSEAVLQANCSLVSDTSYQEGVIIPFNIWMIARQEFVGGVDGFEETVHKFSDCCLNLGDPFC